MTAFNTADGTAFMCDECETEWRTPKLGRGSVSRDFLESLESAKEDGWKAVKVKSRTGKDDWQHRCPDCIKTGYHPT